MTATIPAPATSTVTSASDRFIGVVGLAVMGENLARNIARNGFAVSVYNRTALRTEEFMAEHGEAAGIHAAYDVAGFVASLARPRRVLLMVKAGAPVDAVIAELEPHLEPGDIVIDGGNSYFPDTERRSQALAAKGLSFVGVGVSGGEEGALWGPSLMPGGPPDSYAQLEPMLTAIAAKTEAGPCVTHVGPGGAGHYVKMVHNGIEYGDMQLIAEAYDVMRRALGMSAEEMVPIFERWNDGKLASFLIEITAKVLAFVDVETGRPLVDLIADEAEQKGTGRWTSQNALELATPIPVIDAAVKARSLSAMREARYRASKVLTGPEQSPNGFASDGLVRVEPLERQTVIAALEDALYFAKVSSYAQGMALLRAASTDYNYDLNLSEIARIWKGGCIIRAKLLDPIRFAFAEQSDLENLLLAPHIAETVNATQGAARTVLQIARAYGIPVPAFSAALDYFDTYRQERLPANLIQGQRDYFGAHTYKRLDKPGTFHTIWTPEGTPETVASEPSRREDVEHTEESGERAPIPGDLPPGSDEDRALAPSNRDLQQDGEMGRREDG